MGILVEYFVAGSDDEARAVLEDGPGGVFEIVDGVGIEPVVELGMFQELLTGQAFETQLADPSSRRAVSTEDDTGAAVLDVGPALVEALAAADHPTLVRLSGPWSQIEEFGGAVDPADLLAHLQELQQLARHAQTSSKRLYCWLSP